MGGRGSGSTNGTHPSVVKLSLGGTTHSNALDATGKALVDQGVVMVIAAGNDGVDVGDASLVDLDEAMTVVP
jgi:subtilisin family serine protease